MINLSDNILYFRALLKNLVGKKFEITEKTKRKGSIAPNTKDT